jgi:cobalt-zinc-cadmium efflux system outer membrane protein
MIDALLLGFALAALPPVDTGAPAPTLTLEQALARPRPGLAAARLESELAELEANLAQTRGWLREGASLGAEAGWRRSPPDGDGADFGVEIELPLASRASRESRAALAESLASSRDLLGRAALLADRQLVVEAYLAAWAAQQRLALRRDDLRQLDSFTGRLREQIAAGAVAAFQAGLADAELRAARGLAAEAEAELQRTWSVLVALAALPVVPIPELDRPTLTPTAAGTTSLTVESLRAEQRLAEARGRWNESRELSRSGIAASLAREGDEDVALVGWRWKIPLAGEKEALQRRTASELAWRDGSTRRQLAELEARREASRALLDSLPEEAADPKQLETVWQAAELRVREGKDSPAEALTIRRALIAARLTALDLELRRLAALAELAYLSQEIRR